MSLRQLIRKDRRVRKLYRMLRGGSYAVNTASFIRELESSHTSRLTRRLSVEDVLTRFQSRFLRAVLQNQANRSRYVEIKIRCFATSARLETHLKKLRQYLMAEYAEQLRRAAGTKDERLNIIDNALAPALELQQEIKTAMDIADLIINDVDQVGWTIKNIITAMELIREKGAQL